MHTRSCRSRGGAIRLTLHENMMVVCKKGNPTGDYPSASIIIPQTSSFVNIQFWRKSAKKFVKKIRSRKITIFRCSFLCFSTMTFVSHIVKRCRSATKQGKIWSEQAAFSEFSKNKKILQKPLDKFHKMRYNVQDNKAERSVLTCTPVVMLVDIFLFSAGSEKVCIVRRLCLCTVFLFLEVLDY